MAVLSAQTIRELSLVSPCYEASKDSRNCSRGLSACGYDLSIDHEVRVYSLPRAVAFLYLSHIAFNVAGVSGIVGTVAFVVGMILGWMGLIGLFGFFRLTSANECFDMPYNVVGNVCDKSSLARRGIVVLNTIAEPGWRGFLTIEVLNFGPYDITLKRGDAIAQVVFKSLDKLTELPYDGKYQDQQPGPQEAI